MIRILITSHGGMAQGMVQSVKMLVGEQENLDYVTFDEDMGQDELDELYAECHLVDVSPSTALLPGPSAAPGVSLSWLSATAVNWELG